MFDRIFSGLAGAEGVPGQLKIDATHLKAHRTAASLLFFGEMHPPNSSAKASKRGCSPSYWATKRRLKLKTSCGGVMVMVAPLSCFYQMGR